MSRKRYSPEQIIGMLREAEVALAQGENTVPVKTIKDAKNRKVIVAANSAKGTGNQCSKSLKRRHHRHQGGKCGAGRKEKPNLFNAVFSMAAR